MVSIEEFGELQAALMKAEADKVVLQDRVSRMGPGELLLCSFLHSL